MTRLGGSTERGIIFSINQDGLNFQVLHKSLLSEFSDGAGDTLSPTTTGNLVRDGYKLYGGTSWGGASDNGQLFSYSLPNTPTPTPSPSPSTDDSADTAANNQQATRITIFFTPLLPQIPFASLVQRLSGIFVRPLGDSAG